jgi:hypothetical protein
MAFALQDADEMLLNRGAQSYRVSGRNFKSSFDRLYLSKYGDTMEGDLTIQTGYQLTVSSNAGNEGSFAVYDANGSLMWTNTIDGGTY